MADTPYNAEEYKKALAAEWQEENLPADVLALAAKARTQLIVITGVGIGTIMDLAANAESETVRFNAAKFLIENALYPERNQAKAAKPAGELPGDHPLHVLFQELGAKKSDLPVIDR